MKKKLLEKDSFYLALFVCVCFVAVGGVWFTKNNVDELASNNGFVTDANKNNEDELHLIKKDKNDALPTATDSKENLKQAKEKQKDESKLDFLGNQVIREYSEKQPSYSKTLDVWEIHKGLDVSSNKGQEVKSLLSGTVADVFKDDQYGMSVKVKSENGITVVYSNLDSKIKVKKEQAIKQGECLGTVGDTTTVESEDGNHVHVQAYKNDKSIDPMTLIK
ncbi:peptidoglycan DD-metalloendopeptidase family protein [Romboutsia sp.]|uniref:peptidoglycan DD-metalloendopeptidase family protein n=1 Tax=Romboutsia sp. TaxID=1965302 RepID=UPI003F40C45F